MQFFANLGRGLFGVGSGPAKTSAPNAPVSAHPIFGGVQSLFHLPTHTPKQKIPPSQLRHTPHGSNS